MWLLDLICAVSFLKPYVDESDNFVLVIPAERTWIPLWGGEPHSERRHTPVTFYRQLLWWGSFCLVDVLSAGGSGPQPTSGCLSPSSQSGRGRDGEGGCGGGEERRGGCERCWTATAACESSLEGLTLHLPQQVEGVRVKTPTFSDFTVIKGCFPTRSPAIQSFIYRSVTFSGSIPMSNEIF